MRLADLPTPSLLLDLDKLEANIGRMAGHTSQLGVRLRPHIKTHKCLEIGRLQAAAGARGITVSTLFEAEAFAAAGFDDITWAFPLILSRLGEAIELARRIRLHLVVDSREALAAVESSGVSLPIFLKVDCGYHRAGVDPNGEELLELARQLDDSPRLRLAGILSHAGHSYEVSGRQRLAAVAEEERAVMAGCAERLRGRGIPVETVSVGSTPGMSAVRDLAGIDEARPGNYVFYDGMQVGLGACAVSDCALTVWTSVVSRAKDHSIVDAGALALSKDDGDSDPQTKSYGLAFADYAAGELDPARRLFGLSQEHGWMTGSHPIGEKMRLLPQHSCLTAALFDVYQVVRGDRVLDTWKILRGR